MSGIGGIIGKLRPSNEAALRRLAAALAHRGPAGGRVMRDERATAATGLDGRAVTRP